MLFLHTPIYLIISVIYDFTVMKNIPLVETQDGVEPQSGSDIKAFYEIFLYRLCLVFGTLVLTWFEIDRELELFFIG